MIPTAPVYALVANLSGPRTTSHFTNATARRDHEPTPQVRSSALPHQEPRRTEKAPRQRKSLFPRSRRAWRRPETANLIERRRSGKRIDCAAPEYRWVEQFYVPEIHLTRQLWTLYVGRDARLGLLDVPIVREGRSAEDGRFRQPSLCSAEALTVWEKITFPESRKINSGVRAHDELRRAPGTGGRADHSRHEARRAGERDHRRGLRIRAGAYDREGAPSITPGGAAGGFWVHRVSV